MRNSSVLIISIAAAAVCLLGLPACTKDYSSRTIRFSARTRTAAPATKTAYSGQTYSGTGSSVFERIDWAPGDVIRIASDKATHGSDHYFDYTISSSTIKDNEQLSEAKMAPDSGTGGLEWGEGLGDYHFWGIYPAHPIAVSGGTASASSLSIPAVQNALPANRTETAALTSFAPDLSSAWMLADAAGVAENASNFSLDFYPAFTAFEFTLKSQDNDTFKITGFTLSSASTDVAGSFDAGFAAGGASTYSHFTSGSSSISVDFGAGVEITQTHSLTFTVLALPQVLGNLTITFRLDRGGVPGYRTLALRYADTYNGGAYINFAPCQKHRITGLALPGGELMLSALTVKAWDQVTNTVVDYSCEYTSPMASKIKALEKYRRFDSDNDYSSWDGSYIVISYGYMNHDDEVVITTAPGADLRSAFSPVIELATEAESHVVLRLVLDNPNFKFIQYADNAASVADHSVADAIDIASGTDVKTYFSVVPVKQFRIDAPESEKKCTVNLLSIETGTFHEMSFNNNGTPDYYRLPGTSSKDLTFYYAGPAVYGSTGYEYNPDGTL